MDLISSGMTEETPGGLADLLQSELMVVQQFEHKNQQIF